MSILENKPFSTIFEPASQICNVPSLVISAECPGTLLIPFKATVLEELLDNRLQVSSFQSICILAAAEKFSTDELRLADYVKGLSTNHRLASPSTSDVSASAAIMKCEGTNIPYSATILEGPDANGTLYSSFQSICFQPPCMLYSNEELRIADYADGRGPTDHTSTNNLRHFNVSLLPTIESFFEALKSPVLEAATECQGTDFILYKAFVTEDPGSSVGQLGSFENICFQPDCARYSNEELRIADYARGCVLTKYKSTQDFQPLFPCQHRPDNKTHNENSEAAVKPQEGSRRLSEGRQASKRQRTAAALDTETPESTSKVQLLTFVPPQDKSALPSPASLDGHHHPDHIQASSNSRERPMDNLTSLRDYHLSLITGRSRDDELHEATTSPIFTLSVLEHAKTLRKKKSGEAYSQYGLLAGMTDMLDIGSRNRELQDLRNDLDPRLFFNIAAPSSTFICGSQGSGKSHTLSCLLENCLLPSKVSKLPNPLTGLVFHYDHFISDDGGSPCEAAFLSSNAKIKVRVLCAPTNVGTIRNCYHHFPNITVEPLRIDENNLNTKRMLDLMAVNRDEGHIPLYLHGITRILRDMRILQQEKGTLFSYPDFKRQILDMSLSAAQLGPLNQRLEMLESFMVKDQTMIPVAGKKSGKAPLIKGNDWTHKPGTLTIVDLSCPCVTAEDACALFNICLSIFLEQNPSTGRVVALDEAHKYMNTSAEATTLTNTLLSTIRLQRHLGARTIISTQEPTISPALLDLSSLTIVHRFTSPEWLRALKQHLAGASSELINQPSASLTLTPTSSEADVGYSVESPAQRIFGEIVKLRVGEALLFAPSALLGVRTDGEMERLGTGYRKIRVRSRLTEDGGKSVMAS